MTIREIAGVYNDFMAQVIRVYKNGGFVVCNYGYKLAQEMTDKEWHDFMDTKFSFFEANGVAIHFYI